MTTTPAPATARVHLLLQVDPQLAAEAARDVAAVPGVCQATRTSGSYDVIAVAEVASEEELATILGRVRKARGLCRLRICRS